MTSRLASILTVLTFLPVFTAEAQQKIGRKIPIDPDASIRIYNLPGSTRVIGWDQNQIAVTGTAPPGATFFMGGAGRVAKLGFDWEEKPGVPPPKLGGAATGFLEVRVPRGARVWIKSAEGSIEVEALTGEVDLATVGGSIKVVGSLHLITAETIDGNLELSGPSELVRAKTGGGRILLSRPAGDLTLSTVGGPVILLDAQPGSARIETVSGSVSYDGILDRKSSLEIQTHSGEVELKVPPKVSAEFDLHSMDGTVQIALSPKLPSPKPERGKPQFFAAGGGGAHVVVRSFKGNIRLLGRD